MLIRISCPCCGDDGEGAVTAEGNELACPRCGARLVLSPVDPEQAALSWVGSTGEADGPTPEGPVDACVSCSYEGTMLDDESLGYPICPECGASQRDRKIGKQRRVPCPECGRPIEAERGKSVVCPHCQTFLGCLIPENPGKRWWRRSR